ncbi:MAG: hypothetical protein R6U26_02625 [Candidatus Undinarchaeales archaeon]
MAKKPKIKLASTDIEDIILGRIKKVPGSKLSPKKAAEILRNVFMVDSPRIAPLSPAGKIKFSFGEGGIHKKQAGNAMKFMKTNFPSGSVASEKAIVTLIKRLGIDEKNDLTVTALENAAILYLSENMDKGKKVFADQTFTSILRTLFSYFIADLDVLKDDLATLHSNEFMVRRHIKLIQDEYEDVVEWEKWANIFEDQTGNKQEKQKKEGEVKKLREAVSEAFRASKKFVAGTADSPSSLLSNLQRQASALWQNIAVAKGKEKVAIKETKMWLKEGKEVLDYVEEFHSKKKNPKVLSDKELVKMSKEIGRGINLMGIQSALIQKTTDAIENDMDMGHLLRDPIFISLIRLYFAAMIMKLAAVERFMVIIGETKVMTRLRGGRVSENFEDLIKAENYKSIMEKAEGKTGLSKKVTKGRGKATA